MKLRLTAALLTIHHTDGSLLYAENATLAALDSGVQLGVGEYAALEYDGDHRVLVYIDGKGCAHPREGNDGDLDCESMLASLPALLDAQAARNDPVVVPPPPLTAEEEARIARLQADRAECLQAKLDAAVMALVDATPTQLLNYARNNFPSLSLAEQNKMGTILHILAVAVRPTVR